MRRVRVHRLGVVPYGDALELQHRVQRARTRGVIPDTLLLLEHPKVLTLGRGAKEGKNILLSTDELEAAGYEVHEIGRGGDVTYHGPGQIVGYPIIDLAPDRQDVRRYVRDLEELMIQLAGVYDVEAGRIDKLNGTWVGNNKIGAIGVRISRWVTMHGFAFNVCTKLEDFSVIIPCGLQGKGVTSLAKELEGRADAPNDGVQMNEVLDRLEERFAEIFDAELEPAEEAPLSGLPASAWAPEPWRDSPRS